MRKAEEHVRGAIDRRLSSLEASAGRRAQIRRRINREEEPVMKRKLTVGMAFALALALALTGAALAAGVNLFEYFGKTDARLGSLAPQAVLETQSPQTVESDDLGETVATITNAYYDGQSLMVAYSIVNGERMEAFTPTEEQLAAAEPAEWGQIAIPLSANEEEAQLMADFNAAMEAGAPMGFARYSVYPSDHAEVNGSVDVGPYMEHEESAADGEVYRLREFESPLPEEIQNLDEIEVQIRLYQGMYALWFDGEDLYQLPYERQPAGAMTATVKRAEADGLQFAQYEGAGEYNGVKVQAEATASAVFATVTLTADGDAFVLPETEEDSWIEVVLRDEMGNTYRAQSYERRASDEITVRFDSIGSVPGELTAYVVIETEGEWEPEAALAEAKPIVLSQK